MKRHNHNTNNNLKTDAEIIAALQEKLLENEQILLSKDSTISVKDEIISTQNEQIQKLQHQLHHALQARFGRRSEKQVDSSQIELQFDEPATTAEQAEIRSADESIHVPAHTRKKAGRKPLPADLPRVEVIHDIQDAEKICACGSALCCIGDETNEQLEYIPAKVQVIVNKRLKYACKACESTIKTAAMPNQLIPKSITTPSLLAHIAVSKYDDHLPLYRQEEILQRHGIDIARNTLGDWMIRVGDALTPLIKLLQHEIISYDVAFSDETPLQVLKQPNKTAKQKSYMWIFSGGAPDKKCVIYHYANSRASNVPIRFFEDFSGYIHADGYAGYLPLLIGRKIKIVACLAHIRRKFFAITQSVKTEGLAHQAMQWITQLYAIEKECSEASHDFDTIKSIRLENAKPILDEMHAWLTINANKVPPKMPIGDAIHYAIKQWPHLLHYMEDGRLEIDNNRSERAVKPFVIGRKNWLFAGNHHGAIAGANLFSLIETAKIHGLNPYNYLRHVFTNLPKAETLEQLEALLPWNCKSVVS